MRKKRKTHTQKAKEKSFGREGGESVIEENKNVTDGIEHGNGNSSLCDDKKLCV